MFEKFEAFIQVMASNILPTKSPKMQFTKHQNNRNSHFSDYYDIDTNILSNYLYYCSALVPSDIITT